MGICNLSLAGRAAGAVGPLVSTLAALVAAGEMSIRSRKLNVSKVSIGRADILFLWWRWMSGVALEGRENKG